MMPANTSPEPAVASQTGALVLISARPSGEAMTVSAPLYMTAALARLAAEIQEMAVISGQHYTDAAEALKSISCAGREISEEESASLSLARDAVGEELHGVIEQIHACPDRL